MPKVYHDSFAKKLAAFSEALEKLSKQKFDHFKRESSGFSEKMVKTMRDIISIVTVNDAAHWRKQARQLKLLILDLVNHDANLIPPIFNQQSYQLVQIIHDFFASLDLEKDFIEVPKMATFITEKLLNFPKTLTEAQGRLNTWLPTLQNELHIRNGVARGIQYEQDREDISCNEVTRRDVNTLSTTVRRFLEAMDKATAQEQISLLQTFKQDYDARVTELFEMSKELPYLYIATINDYGHSLPANTSAPFMLASKDFFVRGGWAMISKNLLHYETICNKSLAKAGHEPLTRVYECSMQRHHTHHATSLTSSAQSERLMTTALERFQKQVAEYNKTPKKAKSEKGKILSELQTSINDIKKNPQGFTFILGRIIKATYIAMLKHQEIIQSATLPKSPGKTAEIISDLFQTLYTLFREIDTVTDPLYREFFAKSLTASMTKTTSSSSSSSTSTSSSSSTSSTMSSTMPAYSMASLMTNSSGSLYSSSSSSTSSLSSDSTLTTTRSMIPGSK